MLWRWRCKRPSESQLAEGLATLLSTQARAFGQPRREPRTMPAARRARGLCTSTLRARPPSCSRRLPARRWSLT
eukprot:scaffold52984_cov73-Phaeocystis_antarctica.AAC.2